jgi:hypothetical protein
MSSKFIPPKVAIALTVSINLSISLTSTSISKHRYQQILNNNALPSIQALKLQDHIPSPKTAVPFVITATKLPLAVCCIHY